MGAGVRPGISIHSPRMGRDIYDTMASIVANHFNPLSPHGERPRLSALSSVPPPISIHSPRMGRDRAEMKIKTSKGHISIHSPRMGRDAPP